MKLTIRGFERKERRVEGHWREEKKCTSEATRAEGVHTRVY